MQSPAASPGRILTGLLLGMCLAPLSVWAGPPVEQRLAEMDLPTQVGQLFLVSFPGQGLGAETRRFFGRVKPGGVILYQNNTASPASVARLTDDLQAAAGSRGGPGMLVAIDMEGGRVTRFFADSGFTRFPPGLLVAATGRTERAAAVARAMAEELAAVGVNTNLAPVADVWLSGGGRALGLRTFGSRPRVVAGMVGAFVRASERAGVLACVKHFPGLGAGRVDSHAGLPVIDRSRQALLATELLPFRAAASAGAGAIMVGHAWFPALDPEKRTPASMSEPVLAGLLRAELGFEGLIVSDAMDMGAIQANHTYGEAAIRALAAGADLVAFGSTPSLAEQERAVAEVVQAVNRGRLSLQRIRRSAGRVLHVKASMGLLPARAVDPDGAAGAMRAPAHRRLVRGLAREAVTLVRDGRGLLPLSPGASSAWILTAGLDGLVGGCTGRFPGARVVVLPAQLDEAARLGAVEAAGQAGAVVLVARGRFDPALVAELPADKLVAVATSDPTALLQTPRASTWLVTYSAQADSLDALCDVLSGHLLPAGRLPVGLGPDAPAGSGLGAFVPK